MPAAVTVAGPVLVMDRSADPVTVVLAVAVSLAGLGSGVADETVALLVSVPAWPGAVTTMVITGAVDPAVSVGRVQVTETLPALLHVQPAPMAETNVTPAGSVSATDRLAASDGPVLVTVSWYDTLPAATTVAGPVLVIERSATGPTAVVTELVLLAALGSAVAADTVAVLVRVAAIGGAVTTTVMAGAVVPVASAGRVQVTETLPTFVHVQPVPVADTNVTPAGSVSSTDRFAASEGPMLVTESW